MATFTIDGAYEAQANVVVVGGQPLPQPGWNLPSTINVAQDGTVGVRQYAANATDWTISVSNLPSGVVYDAPSESLVAGAEAPLESTVAVFTLSKSGETNIVDTATVAVVLLGSHDITGLPLDANGWTDFEALTATGYEDARVVFVSNEGNDATATIYGINDVEFDQHGMFQPVGAVNAYATIAAANAALRDGFPDIMLLRRGDEWTSAWTQKNGRNASERQIVASYGVGDRPSIFDAGAGASGKSFFIISSLKFHSDFFNNPKRPIGFGGISTDYLIEDCRFEQTSFFSISGNNSAYPEFTMQRGGFRRCFFLHGECHDGFIYFSTVKDWTLEENVFFEPWNERNTNPANPFGRHYYGSPSWGSVSSEKTSIQNCVVKGNIAFRAERGSFSHRGQGIIENNLLLQTSSLNLGGVGGSNNSIQQGEILNNVVMQGTPNQGGISQTQIRPTDYLVMRGNIYTDWRGVTSSATNIVLFAQDSGGLEVNRVYKNMTIEDNIIRSTDGALIGPRALDFASFYEASNNVVRNNDFQFVQDSNEIIRLRTDITGTIDRFDAYTFTGNRYFSQSSSSIFMPGGTYSGWLTASGETGSSFEQIIYPDPDRTVDTYMTSIGQSGGAEEFANAAVNQARHNWNPAYTAPAVNNYIRAGFGRGVI